MSTLHRSAGPRLCQSTGGQVACWVKRGRHLKLMPVHVPDGLANSDQSENWLISLLIGQAGRANFRYQLRIQLVDAANDCSSAIAASGVAPTE